MQMPARVRS